MPTTEAILDTLLWVTTQDFDSPAAQVGQMAYTILSPIWIAPAALAGYAIDEATRGWYGIGFGVLLIRGALDEPEPKGMSVDVVGPRELESEKRLSRVKMAGLEDRKRSDVRDDERKKRVEEGPKPKDRPRWLTSPIGLAPSLARSPEDRRWDLYRRTLWPERY